MAADSGTPVAVEGAQPKLSSRWGCHGWVLSHVLRRSCRYQNALSEQVETGATVELLFQQLGPAELRHEGLSSGR